MDKGKQYCKQNPITKNDNILVRCERGGCGQDRIYI